MVSSDILNVELCIAQNDHVDATLLLVGGEHGIGEHIFREKCPKFGHLLIKLKS